MDPEFLTIRAVLEFHEQQLRLFGGLPGIGDPGALESAVFAPHNIYLYETKADIFDCAAAYAFHIAKNHPFNDGNKRTGLQSALAFLRLNGLSPSFTDNNFLYQMMDGVAAGTASPNLFASFLAQCCIAAWITRESLEASPKELPAIFSKEMSAAEFDAVSIDYLTSKLRSILIERCEQYWVNSARTSAIPILVESLVFPQVREDLRRQFEM